jgi:hypothetical protein
MPYHPLCILELSGTIVRFAVAFATGVLST